MVTIPVALSQNGYDIVIDRGGLSRAGQAVATATAARRVALVSDTNVAPLYAATVKDSLEAAGIAVQTVALPAGEESKTDATLHLLYGLLLDRGFTRGDGIVALGGGVVGDVAGYAAATLFRGMDWIQLPTSLMAQADSAVGGKTGIDLPQGKNLLGAIYQPKLVLVDPDCLDTLPPRELSSGMAEIIKYGMIADETILKTLEEPGELRAKLEGLLPRCLAIKAKLVAEDERDLGVRRLLNFGHTLGHALETALDYRCTHGEAVAWGMDTMLYIEKTMQGLDTELLQTRLLWLLEHYGLDSLDPVPPKTVCRALVAALALDKKGNSKQIQLVQVVTAGKGKLVTVERQRLLDHLEELGWI
ncbi:MAG: 3-dehydroquinate synthase [Oscillospiraceae bacterium]